MEKIDMHEHLSRETIRSNEKKIVSSAKEMLPHLKDLGIAKAVLMSSGESEMTAKFGTNEENMLIVLEDPQHFAWMCNLDPVEEETVYERLKKYKEQGAIGIGELMINRRMDDPFLRSIFDAAEKLELPVTFHMSPEVGFSYGIVDDPGLPLLEQTLIQYPKLKLLGHSQSFWIEMSADAPTAKEERNAWGEGPVVPGGRVPELFNNYSNLYGDLSANSAGHAIMRDPEFGLRFLETYSERLFFATDMVNTDMVFPLGNWLDEQVKAGSISKNAYENICYKNAQRVFGL